MELVDVSLINWSRAQFAMTAMYHWLFVPITLGLGVIMSIMETKYYRSGDEKWKKIAKFWMTLFGINFAIGVATGIILEFEFGTNWSNYSWFVGDIFGAPLAIEGIVAFFMEATFISVMFFGWNRVSKGFHLASTWLTVAGATISALWILVANAWMQYPAGMEFNPDTVRNEMASFWSVLFSPVAVNKFLHSVLSGWVLGGLFVTGISAWFLMKKRETEFAMKSMKIGALFGLVATVLLIITGDGSGYRVAQHQPMKLAAMEALYDGSNGVELIGVGILNPEKKAYDDGVEPVVMKIAFPKLLSYLGYRDLDAFVPGINDIIRGGYPKVDGTVALSFEEMKSKGQTAIGALDAYRKAKVAGDMDEAAVQRQTLETNYDFFGYGYLDKPEDLIPNVPLTFYSFRVMVMLGFYFLAFFVVILIFHKKDKIKHMKWLQWIAILSIPLGYIAGQLGWVVAEVGRQPWAIQDVLPVQAAVSNISANAVKLTFFIFLALFTILLIAEIGILLKQIKQGPRIEEKAK
jgi:cytochrome d ubiquinol oxidase subunit I